MPKSQKRQIVSYPDLANDLDMSASRINTAVGHLRAIIEDQPITGDNYLCSTTQDAGELLSKAALLHLGIHPSPTHDALELADALREKHPNHDWIDIIESLNGLSRKRHVAIYTATIMESFEASLNRLHTVLEFYAVVVETILGKRPGIKGHLLRVCNRIVSFVSSQQLANNWDRLPDDLKQSVLQWKGMAEGILDASAADKRKAAKRRSP